jgi:hypothetical protein
MFEIGIFCVIFLAISYWAVLWLMGRRNDVLHGEFVESEPHAQEPLRQESVRPVFPPRPTLPARPAEAAPEQPAFRPERLESLLKAIKQDLNQLVQK